MNVIIIAILYGLSGFLMKFSDDEYDEKSNKLIAVIIGIISGLIMGFLATHNTDASYIFLGILIGNLIAFKIDGAHHVASLLVFAAVSLIFGLPQLSLITLAICITSAYIDEWGNDNLAIYKKSHFLKVFFDYRFSMKIAIFILALLGFYQAVTGFSILGFEFLNFYTFLFFILFELSYEFSRIVFEKYIK
ncbi:hypothetical protein MBCUT_08360 [Methanobrevibacter cuticularis]|uniref:Uncharacterized protein n=1 Tax=Methanobrevibacter cuticularis TaxID=47311 RepID=A0A166EAJ7_9EURY|nr:hypothetical protein [Methanobrevibacter cuticularis]KZX16450.1 hypothetical protein MBCUT_08360 [Methanobrevibacter cuticularis]